MKFGIWFSILFCFQVDLKIQHLLCSSGFLGRKKQKGCLFSLMFDYVYGHLYLIMWIEFLFLFLVLFFMPTELSLPDCFAVGYLFRGVCNKVAEFIDDCEIRSSNIFWSGILLFENISGDMLCLEAGTAWIISFPCCTWLSSFALFSFEGFLYSYMRLLLALDRPGHRLLPNFSQTLQ